MSLGSEIALDALHDISEPDTEPAASPIDGDVVASVAVQRERHLSEDPSPVPALRESTFCMEDEGLVTFVAEETKFTVHPYFFKRDSMRFRELWRAHPRSSPIVFTDTSATDLERFLGILYPLDFETHAAATAEEWLSVLRIAHAWGFTSVHRLALSRLQSLATAVDKIVCARRFGAPGKWAIEAYIALCTRDKALSLDECRALGLEEVACVYDAWWSVTKECRQVRVVVEEKLRMHGFLSPKIKAPGTAPPFDRARKSEKTSETAGCPSTVDMGDRSTEFADTAGSIVTEEVIPESTVSWSPWPRLDIRDQNNQLIANYPAEAESFNLSHPDGSGVTLRRDGRKLSLDVTTLASIITEPSINGRPCSMGSYELYHGDTITFAQDVTLSDSLTLLQFAHKQAYIVCRDTVLFGAAGLRFADVAASAQYATKNLQSCQDDLKSLEA